MTYDPKTTTIQTILDARAEAETAVVALRDEWNRKRSAFLQDCDRVDAALEGEKESLRSEIAELNQTIRRLSGQLAAGVTGSGRIDRDVKENLRKLIREATARRDEAQATVDGLEEVEPEYNRELFDAAIAAKEAFVAAVGGVYADTVKSLSDAMDSLAREVEQTKGTVRNRISLYDLTSQTAEIESRLTGGRGEQAQPAAVSPDPVVMLGEPLGRPKSVYEPVPVPEPKPYKYRTVTSFSPDGKGTVQTIDNKTGKVVNEKEV